MYPLRVLEGLIYKNQPESLKLAVIHPGSTDGLGRKSFIDKHNFKMNFVRKIKDKLQKLIS